MEVGMATSTSRTTGTKGATANALVSPGHGSVSSGVKELIRRAPPTQLDSIIAEIARRSHGRRALLKAAERLTAEVDDMVAEAIDTRVLIREAGELLSSSSVALRLGQTRQNINELLKRRRILGVRFGTRWKFPSIQLQEHQVLPGLAPVLHSMGDISPWAALDVLLSPKDEPSRRPIEMLRRGDRAAALAAASRAAARVRKAGGGSPPILELNASLDADLDADMRQDAEIDALVPIDPAT
jgi:hypothetical protein